MTVENYNDQIKIKNTHLAILASEKAPYPDTQLNFCCIPVVASKYSIKNLKTVKAKVGE